MRNLTITASVAMMFTLAARAALAQGHVAGGVAGGVGGGAVGHHMAKAHAAKQAAAPKT